MPETIGKSNTEFVIPSNDCGKLDVEMSGSMDQNGGVVKQIPMEHSVVELNACDCGVMSSSKPSLEYIEAGEYIVGVSITWVWVPVVLSIWAAARGEFAIQEWPYPLAWMSLWVIWAWANSLWYWWDMNLAVAKWFDRFTACGCLAIVFSRTVIWGHATFIRITSSVLCVLCISCYVASMRTEKWIWCHAFFRFFIYWIGMMAFLGSWVVVTRCWISLVLATIACYFGHFLWDLHFICSQPGFRKQTWYLAGIGRTVVFILLHGAIASLISLILALFET